MIKNIALTALLSCGFLAGSPAQEITVPVQDGNIHVADSIAIKYAQTIKAEDLEMDLQVLASDSLEGRETGSRGQKLAAEYIKNQFEQAGLKPAGVNGSYFQPFTLEKQSWGEVYVKANDQIYKNFAEVIYYGNAHLPEEKSMEAVFVGRGLAGDYEGLDVTGKAVVIFDSEDKGWRTKLKTAKEKGAAAYIVTSGTDRADFTRTVNNAKLFVDRPKLSFKEDGNENGASIFFFTSPETAAEILGTNLKKLDKAIFKADEGKSNAVKRIKPGKIIFKTERKEAPIETENVLGMVEGTDLKEEIVVVTSHYDHLGIGPNGEIFNGADDNGSGTSAILEMAEAFGKAKEAGHGPRRSVLFMAITAEEKGLLGSEYYVKNPLYPLAQTVANLNIDMVGRTDLTHEGKPDYIYLIGSDKLSRELHELSAQINETYTNLDLDYAFNDENDPNRYYYRSDHYNFAKNNIPVIFYFNGTHSEYHKASDTIEKISFELMEKRTKLFFHTAWELANRNKRVALDKPAK